MMNPLPIMTQEKSDLKHGSVSNITKALLQKNVNYFNRCKSFLIQYRYRGIDLCRVPINVNSARLEASSMCQLKCPLCETSRGILKDRNIGWGYLKFEDFKKFVDNYPTIKTIELSNNGEIFLNPDLNKIIQYGYEKKINLTALNGCNLNTVKEELIESLVKYKFHDLSISIDGASNETYKIYRQGGSFDRVINNIRKINHYKQVYNTEFPNLYWQFILFGHNEHEFSIARNMAQELNMAFKPKVNGSPSYSPVKDKTLVQEYKTINPWPCGQLWFDPQINWDGKLLGCCHNYFGHFDFGNIFEDGLYKCLNSERYVFLKKISLGIEKARDDMPCSKCSIYYKSILNVPSRSKKIVNRVIHLSRSLHSNVSVESHNTH